MQESILISLLDCGCFLIAMTESTNRAPLEPEKAAMWELEHPNVSQITPRGTRGAASRFRRGVWLGFLEAIFAIFGLYGLIRQGGILDSAKTWLAHPKIIPDEPIHALGYAIHLKEPRSNAPTYPNQTRM